MVCRCVPCRDAAAGVDQSALAAEPGEISTGEAGVATSTGGGSLGATGGGLLGVTDGGVVAEGVGVGLGVGKEVGETMGLGVGDGVELGSTLMGPPCSTVPPSVCISSDAAVAAAAPASTPRPTMPVTPYATQRLLTRSAPLPFVDASSLTRTRKREKSRS